MQCKVLIIDDNEDEVSLTERILVRISPGIAVESAMSGEEGLAKLRDGKPLPLLTLLDLKMTGKGGIDTLREIRASERLRNLRVAIVTNSTLESEKKEAMEAGADAFVRKDLDIDQFSKDIKALLKCFSAA
jgi:CheY-like chemotaxis protein